MRRRALLRTVGSSSPFLFAGCLTSRESTGTESNEDGQEGQTGSAQGDGELTISASVDDTKSPPQLENVDGVPTVELIEEGRLSSNVPATLRVRNAWHKGGFKVDGYEYQQYDKHILRVDIEKQLLKDDEVIEEDPAHTRVTLQVFKDQGLSGDKAAYENEDFWYFSGEESGPGEYTVRLKAVDRYDGETATIEKPVVVADLFPNEWAYNWYRDYLQAYESYLPAFNAYKAWREVYPEQKFSEIERPIATPGDDIMHGGGQIASFEAIASTLNNAKRPLCVDLRDIDGSGWKGEMGDIGTRNCKRVIPLKKAARRFWRATRAEEEGDSDRREDLVNEALQFDEQVSSAPSVVTPERFKQIWKPS